MIVPSMNHLRAAMWILGGGVVLLFSLHPGGLQLIGGWFVIGGVVWGAAVPQGFQKIISLLYLSLRDLIVCCY